MKYFAIVFALLFPFALLAHAQIYFTQDATQAQAFGVMVQSSGYLGSYEVGQPVTATWSLGGNDPYVNWIEGCCLRADITFTSTLVVPDDQTYFMYSPFTYDGWVSDETGAGWYHVSGIGYGGIGMDPNYFGMGPWLTEVYVELDNTPQPYQALVQQPINFDGSSIFKSNRGVIPVKFSLTQNGAQTCSLPPATIVVIKTAGGTLGSGWMKTPIARLPTIGSNFRIDKAACQYIYNVAASSLGVGTYRVDISINGIFVGHAVFALK